MKRSLWISAVTVACGLALWGAASLILASEEPDPLKESVMKIHVIQVQEGYQDPYPDKSPYWRAITDDLGILLREDERFGYRGRLYARVNGKWNAVATDGIDSFGFVPLKR
ncbi:MAG TPA: hypothetical protein VFB67_13655 [Candidatus Polarisedimenticolaceae bacterium]|nr:hypothetical protein [Candidatus Polarisedimenticolaceae bacterium]